MQLNKIILLNIIEKKILEKYKTEKPNLKIITK